MVIIGRYLFHTSIVLILESVSSLSRTKELSDYDGSRGRMDRVYDTHDEFFQRNNRPKRTPRRSNLQANSDSQGVSCPTSLTENSLDSLGNSDRMKEVHMSCSERKSSGAKVVASFKGKSMKCNAAISDNDSRGAHELFKNTSSNYLNHAVEQNAQWLILSSQDRIQKPSQGYISQNVSSSISTDRTGKNWIMNHWLVNRNQGMPTLGRTVYRNPNGAKDEARKTQYGKSSKIALLCTGSQLKQKFQAPQSNINAPPISRLKETVMLERGRQFSVPPVQGYLNFGHLRQPPRHFPVQHPQVIQDPFPKKDGRLQTPYDANRLLLNSFNFSYDGPHHYGPNKPPGQLPYPSVTALRQANPAFFQSRVTPGNEAQFTYILYNVSLPSENPKIFHSTNETRNGPWAPGSLEVDIPPGYPHQPKLPKTTTRSFDAVNIQDLPKGVQKIPVNQPSHQKGGQQDQPFPNEIPQQDSWRYHGGPYSNYQYQQQSSVAKQEAPVSSYEKLGVTSFLIKTTVAYKGVFGKLKKEESKIKSIKPPKISVSNPKARLPPVDGQAKMPRVGAQGGTDKYAPLQQEEVLSKLHNSVDRHEVPHSDAEAKVLDLKAAIPLKKTSQGRNLSPNYRGHQEYRNFSGDMSHILDPPVSMDASLYANKAHKIASKFVSSEDVMYVPFRGVPRARNDEVFYDKNLHFLGKIDRPPLVNTKKRKWCKLNERFNSDRVHKLLHADYPVGYYSEPVDFHSDMTVEDFGSDHEPKTAGRHNRKCQHNRGHNWSHSRTKI